MVTSSIGRIFLDAYNEKYESNYDAKSFFLKVFHPLFFDHPKYMMTAGNSPLENPKISWEKMITGKIDFETHEKRKDRLNKLLEKISNSEADAAIAIGYASIDTKATTSGQVSNLNTNTTNDDIYFSWIGAGLGIGVQGGLIILFNNPELLLDIFEGWEIYRTMLNETPNLKGNQIPTWNGQWLSHRYNKRNYNETKPMNNFNPTKAKDCLLEIEIKSWTEVIIPIAMHLNKPQMIGYIYNIGQTNTTIGFIPFNLEKIRHPIELYIKLFDTEDGALVEKLFGTANGFKANCKLGSIGIKAMEPKGLRTHIDKATVPKIKNKEEQINYNTYIIWLIAMLNNQDMWVKAQEFAKDLQHYTLKSTNAKRVNTTQVDKLLSTTRKVSFIEAMTEIIKEAENANNLFKMVELVNSMPNDNVPYLLTLVRFHYAALNNSIIQQTSLEL